MEEAGPPASVSGGGLRVRSWPWSDILRCTTCWSWGPLLNTAPDKGSSRIPVPQGPSSRYHSASPSCCRKEGPFQGPKLGSCLTLVNELPKETHV